MAVTKKAAETETFTAKTAGDLAAGDRFREVGANSWQQIVSLRKEESSTVNPETSAFQEIVFCRTTVDGSPETFLFSAFSSVPVEVLN